MCWKVSRERVEGMLECGVGLQFLNRLVTEGQRSEGDICTDIWTEL